MADLNRYKFTFSDKQLTLTTEHDNLFMEEIERVAKEKYQALQDEMPTADTETLAILLAINTLSVQLARELEFDKQEEELARLRRKMLEQIQTPDSANETEVK
ncbi:cell division protein ZapA (FtsZ GTPase activity inhibitor) [Streptococcus rupicaprae]|uniref:Cell division protein ZapA (FtsZ GTPase activity inhibitor) n=1 Tax=Streptococcus rupicaprae TaxID=759619 RepID=A0ABV2FF36_9STRE